MGKGNEKLISQFKDRFNAIKNERILLALEKTAWDLIKQTNVPVVTHNLWDSIGCGIYHNGVLMKMIYPDKKAQKPRNTKEKPLYSMGGVITEDRAYWGIEELEDMIENPPSRITTHLGWCLYYVAAMPYSQIQNDKGVNVLRDEVIKPTFETYIRTL